MVSGKRAVFQTAYYITCTEKLAHEQVDYELEIHTKYIYN